MRRRPRSFLVRGVLCAILRGLGRRRSSEEQRRLQVQMLRLREAPRSLLQQRKPLPALACLRQ